MESDLDEWSWQLAVILAVVCLPALLYLFRTPRSPGYYVRGLFIVFTVFIQLFGGLFGEKVLGSAALGWLLTYLGLLLLCWWWPKRERNVIGRRNADARLSDAWGEAVKPKRKWWHLE